MTEAARRGGWRIEQRTGRADELHRRWPAVEADPATRAVAVCRVTRPAVVLGSTQPEHILDVAVAARRGIDVARRRSGGGVVLLRPDDPLWVDVWVPESDPLTDPDVGRAFRWLGEVWAETLAGLGALGLDVVRDGPSRRAATRSVVCFGSTASGEVVTTDGRKTVGLSQRRDRAGARFSCACLGRWEPDDLVALLAGTPGARASILGELRRSAVGLADLTGGDPAAVLRRAADSFLHALR